MTRTARDSCSLCVHWAECCRFCGQGAKLGDCKLASTTDVCSFEQGCLSNGNACSDWAQGQNDARCLFPPSGPVSFVRHNKARNVQREGHSHFVVALLEQIDVTSSLPLFACKNDMHVCQIRRWQSSGSADDGTRRCDTE